MPPIIIRVNNMAEENVQAAEPQFAIQKVYLKDVSFESPNAPAVFGDSASWAPEINVQLNSANQMVGENIYEVILNITVTAKQGEKTAFLVELKQAGLFALSGFPEENLKGMLGAYCPEALFPFAREAVADFVNKGGFPPVMLMPVNFNALYAQQQQQAATAAADQETAH